MSTQGPRPVFDACTGCAGGSLWQHADGIVCHRCGLHLPNTQMLDHEVHWGTETFNRTKPRYAYKRQGHLKKQVATVLNRAQVPPRDRALLYLTISPLFKQLEVSFAKVVARPGETRHNFISYQFTIHRILELLGYDELLPACKQLKSRTRRDELERLWQLICEDAEWEFIPLLATD